MEVSAFAAISPLVDLGSCRLVSSAGGMLKPHALVSALCAHHGERTVGHGKAAVVSVADNESSSHGFKEERLSPREMNNRTERAVSGPL